MNLRKLGEHMKDKKIALKTSHDVALTGKYSPDCCNVEVLFEKGQTFQRCPRCERLTIWQLVTVPKGKAA